MRKWIAFIAIGFFSVCARAEVISLNQFSGLNSDDSPITLQEGQTPDSENVVTDDGYGLKGRKGFIRYSTEPVASGLWEFPLSNGTRYLITRSGGYLKATTDGNFTVTIGTVPTDRVIACATLGDKFFYSDTLNGLKYWTGSAIVASTPSMTFSMLATWKGRLVGAGKPGSERIIFLSEYLDGTDFALVTNPAETDPAQITVSGALDENIQAIYSSFQDKLIWFKKNSFGGLYGSRRSNFTNRTFSDKIGVASVETIQDCDGKLRWLGNNRKVYEFDGATFGPINDQVDDIFADVSQGDANSRTATLSDATYFDSGDYDDYLTTSPYPGSLSCNVFFSTQFNYVSNLDTMTSPGIIRPVWGDSFDYFRNGTNGTYQFWTSTTGFFNSSVYVGGGTATIRCPTAFDGFPSRISPVYPLNRTLSHGTSFYFSISSRTNSCSWSMDITTITAYYLSGPVSHMVVFDGGVYISTSFFSFSLLGTYPQSWIIYISTNYYSLTRNGVMVSSQTGPIHWSTSTSLSYSSISIYPTSSDQSLSVSAFSVSPVVGVATTTLDTTIVSPNFGYFISSMTNVDMVKSSCSFQSFSSADGTTYDAPVQMSTGSLIQSSSKRYLRESVRCEQLEAWEPFSVSLSTVQGARVFMSPVIDFGSQVTSFNPITFSDTKLGGLIAYRFQTSTNSNVSLFLSTGYTNYTIGTNPTNPVRRYGAFIASFTATDTDRLSLDEIIFSWSEGSNIKASSGYIDQRYWIGCAISSTSNNKVLVYDKNRQWQRYSGYVPEVMGMYNSRLYVGNTHGVFLSEQSYSDNGAPINSYYTVKTLAPSNLDLYSKFVELRFTTDNSDSTLIPTFQIDEGGTDYSFGSMAMNQKAGIQNLKFPFSTSEVQQGKFINMKFSVTGSSFWRLLNGNLYYDKDVVAD